MGCCPASWFTPSSDISCLVYGQPSTFHIEDLLRVVPGGNGRFLLAPNFRASKAQALQRQPQPGHSPCVLEFAHVWTPLNPQVPFAAGQFPSKNTDAQDIFVMMLRAQEFFDGREELLFAATVTASVQGAPPLQTPSVLVLTSLGALGVLCVEKQGRPIWQAHFHIHQLRCLQCPTATAGELVFDATEVGPTTAGGKPSLGGPNGGKLTVVTSTAALAQLVAALQAALSVLGTPQGLKIMCVADLAQAVQTARFWAPPAPPPDGGFSALYAATCVAQGRTVRNTQAQTLGVRYFTSVPLLRLDLTDVAPKDPITTAAVAKAWKGNGYFRSLCLNRKVAQGELSAYSEALRQAPIFEVDLAGAEMTPQQVQVLGQALSVNPYKSLLVLNLSGSALAGLGATALAHSLEAGLPPPTQHSFRELRFASCQLAAGDPGSMGLLKLIGSRCSRLEVLDLSRNPLGQQADPELACLAPIWDSAALKELLLADTGLPLFYILPQQPASAPAPKRPRLKLDIAGCPLGGCAGRLPPLLAQVRDLVVVAQRVLGDQPGILPALLGPTAEAPPRRTVEVDLLDCQNGMGAALMNSGGRLSSQVSLRLGHSNPAAGLQTAQGPGVGQVATALSSFVQGAPGTVLFKYALVDVAALATLAIVQKCCVESWDPRASAWYGDSAIRGLGVTLPPPPPGKEKVTVTVPQNVFPGQAFAMLLNGLTVMVPCPNPLPWNRQVVLEVDAAPRAPMMDTRVQMHVAQSPLNATMEMLRRALEAETGIEALHIEGSAPPGNSGVSVASTPLDCPPIPLPVASSPAAAGPLLAAALQGLATNKTLLHLDVSNNLMGDAGAIVLGRALKTNRTLRSLNLDGNFITVTGWQSFRSCLHGNKKLSQFTFPQADLRWLRQHWGGVIAQCNQQIAHSATRIKMTFKAAKGRRTPHVLQVLKTEVENKTNAKKRIGALQRLDQALEKVVREIQQDVMRNAQLAASELTAESRVKAAKPLWAEARLTVKQMEALEASRQAGLEGAKQKAWERRNALWQVWAVKIQKLGKKKKDIRWFVAIQERKVKDLPEDSPERQCLTDAEARAILNSITPDCMADCAPEIQKTLAMLAEEEAANSKFASIVVGLDNKKMDLQALVTDPAWMMPPADSYGDVIAALQKYGIQQGPQQAVPLPPPQLLMGSSGGGQAAQVQVMTAQAFHGAPPATPAAAAAGPITVAGAARPGAAVAVATPMAAAAPAVAVATPVQAVAVPATATPAYAIPGPAMSQVQYDLLRLHQQRWYQQQQPRQPVQVAPLRWNTYGQRQWGVGQSNQGWGTAAAVGGGVGAALGMAMMWNYIGSHNQRADSWNMLACGHYKYSQMPGCPSCQAYHNNGFYGSSYYGGDTYYYNSHSEWNYIGSPPCHFQPHVIDVPPYGSFDPPLPDIPDYHDDIHDAIDRYGAGGEEPPLPDGGRDEPKPAGACPAGPVRSRAHWLPPVRCSEVSRRKSRWQPTLRADVEAQWEAQATLQQEVEKAMSRWFGTIHEDLPYVKEHDVLLTRWPATSFGEEVTVVTQCSEDRLARLRDLCLAWAPGPVSVAVFVPTPGDRARIVAALQQIQDACAELGGSLIAALVHALPQPAVAYDGLYPVNALRNVAVDGAPTDLVFVLDVDFVPSRGLRETLLSESLLGGGLRAALDPVDGSAPSALVVPAFELRPGEAAAVAEEAAALPRTFAALEECGGRASGFHTGHFPAGHRATDFARWRSLARLPAGVQQPWAYDVRYEEYFEPYVVLNRVHAPRFDERFRGYGLNKCSFLRHLHALNFRFRVLAAGAHFVVAAEHKKSASWEKIYGRDADPAQATNLALLWRLFLQGLPDAGAAPARAAAAAAKAPVRPPPLHHFNGAALLCRAAAAAVADARKRGLFGELPVALAKG